MVLTDRIMGGVYPNFVVALQQIALTEGNSLTLTYSLLFTHLLIHLHRYQRILQGLVTICCTKNPFICIDLDVFSTVEGDYSLTLLFILALTHLLTYLLTHSVIILVDVWPCWYYPWEHDYWFICCCWSLLCDDSSGYYKDKNSNATPWWSTGTLLTHSFTLFLTHALTQVYLNMYDCLTKILSNEGPWALYRALPPRLLAVVPMIGIQFGVYELMKRVLLKQPAPDKNKVQKKGK
jgi:hypothetical protein